MGFCNVKARQGAMNTEKKKDIWDWLRHVRHYKEVVTESSMILKAKKNRDGIPKTHTEIFKDITASMTEMRPRQ